MASKRNASLDNSSDPRNELRQIQVIHLSDMHFGAMHQFDPEASTGGDRLTKHGVRSLADKLAEDLGIQMTDSGSHSPESSGPGPNNPVIACLTGDFAEYGSYEEFRRAEGFVRTLAGSSQFEGAGMSRIFTVPGNHDVLYDKSNIGERWLPYTDFHNRLHSTNIKSDKPWELDCLHDRSKDLGALILCINSAIYVEKNKPDEQRGQVSELQLANIRAMLRRVPKAKRDAAIRIALVHHHPVLVPPLAEAHRDYDAVQRSGQLLNILHEFGFHLLLHGHKHLPLTFSEDMRNAFEVTKDHPMLIVAGGSAGSKGLPTSGCNTYNLITVKWHKEAGQTRLRVVTRGLDIFHRKTKQRMISKDWAWRTLRQDDRSFALKDHIVTPKLKTYKVENHDAIERDDSLRKQQYALCRRNMPVVDIRPSLDPGQAYEATFWIVPHRPDKPGYESPKEVVWSAGSLFEVVTVKAKDDPRFCARFDYWGAMLIQAELRFKKGPPAFVYVYARVPGREAQIPPLMPRKTPD